MEQQYYKYLISALLLAFGFTAESRATDGHQLIGIGPIQKGLGGAGVARAKDATWVLLNPASIIQLDRRLDITLEQFAPRRTLSPAGPIANPEAGKMSDNDVFYIPTFGLVIPFESGTMGIGFYGVNGMGVNFSNARTAPGAADGFDRRTEYSVAKFALIYAYPLGNDWTIGFGPSLDFARFRTDMLTAFGTQTDGRFRWDKSYGAGFQLGLLKEWERFQFGLSYISRQWMKEFSDYDDLFKSSLDLPQTLQTGIAYLVRSNCELFLDYKFLNWSGISQLGDDPSDGGFGWSDQHILKTGVNWQASSTLTLRSGFSYAKSPIDEEVVFANSLFPAITETHASLGFSYSITHQSEIHFTYMHAFENKLTDNGQGSPLGQGTEITLEENTFTLGYSYTF